MLFFSYDGRNVTNEPSSNYQHYETSLGRFRNSPMAVGHWDSTDGIRVENVSSGKWNILNDFPFAVVYIRDYSTVSFNNDMLLFGKFFIIRHNTPCALLWAYYISYLIV